MEDFYVTLRVLRPLPGKHGELREYHCIQSLRTLRYGVVCSNSATARDKPELTAMREAVFKELVAEVENREPTFKTLIEALEAHDQDLYT